MSELFFQENVKKDQKKYYKKQVAKNAIPY